MVTRLEYLLSGSLQVKIPGLWSIRTTCRPYSNVGCGERTRKPVRSDAWRSIGFPETAALEEERAWSVPLGARPDRLLDMGQSDKTDRFLVPESSGTVTLHEVRAIGVEGPRGCH